MKKSNGPLTPPELDCRRWKPKLPMSALAPNRLASRPVGVTKLMAPPSELAP